MQTPGCPMPCLEPLAVRRAPPGRALNPTGGTAGWSDRAGRRLSEQGSSASSLRGTDSGLLTCVARTFQPPGEAWLLSGFQNRQSYHKTTAEHTVLFGATGSAWSHLLPLRGHDRSGF